MLTRDSVCITSLSTKPLTRRTCDSLFRRKSVTALVYSLTEETLDKILPEMRYWFAKKQKKDVKPVATLKKPPKVLETDFDSYSHEMGSLLAPMSLDGIKCEINKIIAPYLQLSAIKTSKCSSPTTQLFATFSFLRSVLQLSASTDRSYQFKCASGKGGLVGRIHSIVSQKEGVFTQVESAYTSALSTVSMKVIKPVFEASNLIYILNYWRAFGNVYAGIEAVALDKQIGLSFASRIESKNSILAAKLQRFNTLTLSFYRKITRLVSLGIEAKSSSGGRSAAAGLRFSTAKSDAKVTATISNKMELGVCWEERLSESLAVSFSGIYSLGMFEYGISMTFG